MQYQDALVLPDLFPDGLLLVKSSYTCSFCTNDGEDMRSPHPPKEFSGVSRRKFTSFFFFFGVETRAGEESNHSDTRQIDSSRHDILDTILRDIQTMNTYCIIKSGIEVWVISSYSPLSFC